MNFKQYLKPVGQPQIETFNSKDSEQPLNPSIHIGWYKKKSHSSGFNPLSLLPLTKKIRCNYDKTAQSYWKCTNILGKEHGWILHKLEWFNHLGNLG